MASQVLNLVPSVPTALSGLPLIEIADRKRQFVQEYTGNSIGSNSIGIRYQDVILNFTAAEIAGLMHIQGAQVGNMKLGDFEIEVGADSNLSVMSGKFKDQAMEQMRQLGRRVTYKKVIA